MGWMRLNNTLSLPIRLFSGSGQIDGDKPDGPTSVSQHIEDAEAKEYPFQDVDTPDTALPFISGDVVRAAKQTEDRLWIVVDDIVFDCTDYIHEHPGGITVIESFRGESCSWQFWRFHNKQLMQEFGRPLRIGRTEGVLNRFKERTRFVGLRRLGGDDDW